MDFRLKNDRDSVAVCSTPNGYFNVPLVGSNGGVMHNAAGYCGSMYYATSHQGARTSTIIGMHQLGDRVNKVKFILFTPDIISKFKLNVMSASKNRGNPSH